LEPAALCPAYNEELALSWGGHSLESTFLAEVIRTLGALQALLLAELWQLWPWQLQVLEAAAAAQDAADAALVAANADQEAGEGLDEAAEGSAEAGEEAAEAAEGSAEAGEEADGAGTGSDKAGEGSDAAGEQSDAASQEAEDSGSRKGGTNGSGSGSEEDEDEEEEPGQGFCDTFLDRPMSGLLLTPRLVAADSRPQVQGPALAPVTRQELQLALDVMVHAVGPVCGPSALLLVLLLQRAEPELRTAFLNGPEASLLLSTLIAWGARRDRNDNRGDPNTWRPYREEVGDWRLAHKLLLEALGGAEAKSNSAMEPGAFAAAVLGMCFLEPAPGRELDLQHPCRWVGGHG
jgi:hypothetical protein